MRLWELLLLNILYDIDKSLVEQDAYILVEKLLYTEVPKEVYFKCYNSYQNIDLNKSLVENTLIYLKKHNGKNNIG